MFLILAKCHHYSASVEEEMLEKALGASLNPDDSVPQSSNPTPVEMDFASMSEDEQVAYAVRLSMQNSGSLDFLIYLITLDYCFVCVIKLPN